MTSTPSTAGRLLRRYPTLRQRGGSTARPPVRRVIMLASTASTGCRLPVCAPVSLWTSSPDPQIGRGQAEGRASVRGLHRRRTASAHRLVASLAARATQGEGHRRLFVRIRVSPRPRRRCRHRYGRHRPRPGRAGRGRLPIARPQRAVGDRVVAIYAAVPSTLQISWRVVGRPDRDRTFGPTQVNANGSADLSLATLANHLIRSTVSIGQLDVVAPGILEREWQQRLGGRGGDARAFVWFRDHRLARASASDPSRARTRTPCKVDSQSRA